MPKCHDCGKFCRPVEWQMIYSGALPEPQEEIYKCASCVEKNGSFVPQSGIKPEHSCGGLTHSFEVSGLAPGKENNWHAPFGEYIPADKWDKWVALALGVAVLIVVALDSAWLMGWLK